MKHLEYNSASTPFIPASNMGRPGAVSRIEAAFEEHFAKYNDLVAPPVKASSDIKENNQ